MMYNIAKTKKALEYDKILAHLADCCPTQGAKEEALALSPSNDYEEALLLNRQAYDAKRMMSVNGMPPFGDVKDVMPSIERAAKGAMLSIPEILDIERLLKSARLVGEYHSESSREETVLKVNFDRLIPDKQLENRINRTIIADDMIADDASPQLSDIRRKIKQTNSRIRETLQKYITSPSYNKYLQENIITMRNGRYVVPVKSENKNEIKGLVHDTSSSGATMFIEPLSVVEANNELRILETKEKNEIDRILYDLSASCAERGDIIALNYANITVLALIFGKAQLAYRMDASMPIINGPGGDRKIYFKNARHPLLNKDTVVPVTVTLGGEYDTLVITGPNTGGKTVTLKTMGLLTMMSQTGILIPADESSEVCIFNKFLADIGDEQSIEMSLSTFSSHMVNIVEIISNADDYSLVLFDELGSGTDPVEGASLAVSILEHVRRKGSLCAATTHYSELKVYALENERVLNASCEFDIETLRPTYRLITGTPGKSNAFEIAMKLGLELSIIQNAKRLISSEEKKFENVIEKLDVSRIEMEKEKEELEGLKREFIEYKLKAEKIISEKLSYAEKEAERARVQSVRTVEGARAASEFVMNELERLKKKKDADDLANALEEGRKKIRSKLKYADDTLNPVVERKVDEDYVLPRMPVVGDEVFLVKVGKQGSVEKAQDKNGKLTVRVGNITMRVSVDDIMLAESEKDKKSIKKTPFSRSSSAQTGFKEFSASIDLRGNTGDDAWFAVDKYIDDALLSGIKNVTLIHGKGTGALRNALWGYLRKDKRISDFRSGAFGEGDYGVTIVELK